MLFVSLIELKYVISVLNSRFTDTDMHRQLPKIIKVYGIGMVFIIIITLKLVPLLPAAVVILYLFWFPQIICDIYTGHRFVILIGFFFNRRSLCLNYIIGMSCCRIFFPSYLWLYPKSIFDGFVFKRPPGAPSVFIGTLTSFLVIFQVIILLIQYFEGPRSFVPFALLPNAYNYYRPVDNDSEKNKSGLECVICMTDISYITKTIVTTPCDHRFHELCLQQWMNVKPECPTCRGALPPFPY